MRRFFTRWADFTLMAMMGIIVTTFVTLVIGGVLGLALYASFPMHLNVTVPVAVGVGVVVGLGAAVGIVIEMWKLR